MSQYPSEPAKNTGNLAGTHPPVGAGGASRLEVMRAQIQQRQMQEKEQKLLQMLDSQQQRAMQKGNLSGIVPPKYANSNGPPGNWPAQTSKSKTQQGGPSRATPSPMAGSIGAGAGKVRQMFEDRRKGGTPTTSLSGGYAGRSLAGIDKSYPLDPLDTAKAPMSRSGSSKSDPPSNSLSRGRMPPVPATNPTTAPQHARSRPTPTPPPLNIGSSKRPISLDRTAGSRGGSGTSINATTTTPSPVGQGHNIGIRRSSSGFGIAHRSRDENANELLELSNPPPIIPKTTKYRDYANDLESREMDLGVKLRQMNITSPPSVLSPSSTSPTRSPVYGGGTDPRTLQNSQKPLKGKPTSTAPSSGTGKQPTAAARKTSSKGKVVPTKPPVPPPGLEECHICHRYFDKDRISKHEMICKKTSTKKRKVFDPTKMRMEGTEAEPYLRQVSAKGNKKAPPPPKKLDWRKKHEEFINTIRAAKVYTQHVAAGGNPADLPPPPPTDTSDYVQCPHCGRKFNAGAADRHIPKCKDIKSNKFR